MTSLISPLRAGDEDRRDQEQIAPERREVVAISLHHDQHSGSLKRLDVVIKRPRRKPTHPGQLMMRVRAGQYRTADLQSPALSEGGQKF